MHFKNDLLSLIQSEINRAGGKELMMHQIISQAPEWFSPSEVSTSRQVLRDHKIDCVSDLVLSIPKAIYNIEKRKYSKINYTKKAWRIKEDIFIIENFKNMTYREMAEHLKCSPKQVYWRTKKVIIPKMRIA